MSDKNTGGPAFPLATSRGSNEAVNGMTLRDYFAAKAMQGEMANPEAKFNAEQRANWAYEIADAMLRARENT